MKKTNRKEHVIKLYKIVTIIIVVILIVTIPIFGRYIYNSIREAYLDSKEFYFRSDSLSVDSPTYSLTNWGGKGEYSFEINIYSQKNILKGVDYDLNYGLKLNIKDNTKVKCALNSVTGTTTDSTGNLNVTRTISKKNHTDRLIIYVIPIAEISKNDEIEITITAETTQPYAKKISAIFKVTPSIGDSEFEIKDSVNSSYAELVLVNSKSSQSIIKLDFDPKLVRIDLNDEFFQPDNLVNELSNNSKKEWTRTLDITNKYIKSVRFKLQPETSKKIKFYKIDKSIDYTYPNTKEDSYSHINGSVVKVIVE